MVFMENIKSQIKKAIEKHETEDFKECIEILNNLLQKNQDILSKKESNAVAQEIYLLLGQAYQNDQDENKALEIFNKGLNISQNSGDRETECVFLKNIAQSLFVLKQLDQCHARANECLKLSLELKIFTIQADILRLLGSVESQKGNHLKSLELLRKSLQLQQKIGNKLGEARTLYELGLEEADEEDLELSIEHLQRAVKVFKVLGKNKEVMMVQKELQIILEEKDEDEWLEEKVPKKFREKLK